jgi:hypothetical protein
MKVIHFNPLRISSKYYLTILFIPPRKDTASQLQHLPFNYVCEIFTIYSDNQIKPVK